MARFVAGSNNGVAAVLTEEDYQLQQAGQPLQTGYFLFIEDDYLGRHREPWFHGGKTLMDQLLNGHHVTHLGSSLGVPFSNGAFLYASSGDPDDLLKAFQEIAEPWRVYETFGMEITPKATSQV